MIGELDRDDRDLSNALLTAAMYAAPNSKVQKQFSAMINTRRGWGESEHRISIILCKMILVGLQHGVWPKDWIAGEKTKEV